MATSETKGGGIKSAVNVFDIIEAIQRLDGGTLKEIADHVGMPSSTAHAYLSTLKEEGYVIKRDNTYELSLKFLEHGSYVQRSNELMEISQRPLEELTQKSGELASLVVEERGHCVRLDLKSCGTALKISTHAGDRFPMHCHASGKAILAYLPEDDVEAILEHHGLPPATEHSITDPDVLFEELATIRDRGYALNDQESVPGLRAVASPILREGTPLGAVSISGPAHRISDSKLQNGLLELVQSTANEIELRLLAERN